MLRQLTQLQFLLMTIAGIALGHAQSKKTPRPAPPAIIYEVSKVTGNTGEQKKLAQIFNSVRKANGGTLTRPEFLRRIKAREHFEIRHPATCPACNGWKRLIPKNGKRGSDGKVDCRTCRGRGTVSRTYVVKWKHGLPTHAGDRRDPVLSELYRTLGDNAPAQEWFNLARNYESGKLSEFDPNAREFANRAYQQAVTIANRAWRPKEPADSNHNRLHRRIIDEGLKGIAATAPKRKKPEPVPPEQEPPSPSNQPSDQ